MKARMRDWLRKGNEAGYFVQRLSDIVPNPKIDFKVGDNVTVINGYGVEIKNRKIIAIGEDGILWKYGKCIYLDWDCFWMPVHPESLTLQNK